MYDNNVVLADTLQASGAIIGGRFVNYSGAQAHAGDPVYGVAATDARDGDLYAAYVAGRLSVEAGAPINHGQRIKCDDSGRAVPAADADPACGRAVSDVVGAGYPVRIVRFPA